MPLVCFGWMMFSLSIFTLWTKKKKCFVAQLLLKGTKQNKKVWVWKRLKSIEIKSNLKWNYAIGLLWKLHRKKKKRLSTKEKKMLLWIYFSTRKQNSLKFKSQLIVFLNCFVIDANLNLIGNSFKFVLIINFFFLFAFCWFDPTHKNAKRNSWD